MSNKKVKRKFRFNSARVIVSAILFVVSGLLIFSIVKEVMVTVELTGDLQSLNDQLKQIEDETRNLQERKEKLEDPNYIKSYARGEYSITKEGEQVFRLPSSNEKTKENEEVEQEESTPVEEKTEETEEKADE